MTTNAYRFRSQYCWTLDLKKVSYFFLYALPNATVTTPTRILYIKHMIRFIGATSGPSGRVKQGTTLIVPRVFGSSHLQLFAVFEGHGPHGALMAEVCKMKTQERLEQFFAETILDGDLTDADRKLRRLRVDYNRESVLPYARMYVALCGALERDMVDLYGSRAATSGVMATFALFLRKKYLLVANLGDVFIALSATLSRDRVREHLTDILTSEDGAKSYWCRAIRNRFGDALDKERSVDETIHDVFEDKDHVHMIAPRDVPVGEQKQRSIGDTMVPSRGNRPMFMAYRITSTYDHILLGSHALMRSISDQELSDILHRDDLDLKLRFAEILKTAQRNARGTVDELSAILVSLKS